MIAFSVGCLEEVADVVVREDCAAIAQEEADVVQASAVLVVPAEEAVIVVPDGDS